MSSTKNLRRLLVAAAVTLAPAASFAAAGMASSPAPSAAKDLACVWVGQLSTGICVVAPTKDGAAGLH